jgi:ubiquinone/menaquinone biosynthesis C-methylase UbiE
MTDFKDHFSKQSESYARFRPIYPDSLFTYLSKQTPVRQLAWDCATGTGQAAIGLSPYFVKIIATDASKQQITKAQKRHNIYYKVAKAEQSGLPDNSVDLIMVAQALHWFEFDAFFSEAQRVLKNDGLMVICSYNLFNSTPRIDEVIKAFYYHTVYAYWPPERVHIEKNYDDIIFPMAEILTPTFKMTNVWTLDEIVGYISTWSAVKNYNEKTGQDCIKALQKNLKAVWLGENKKTPVEWPLTVRVFKKIRQ